jgi:hypothetical protein
MERRDQQVDELDEDERRQKPTDAKDKQIPLQQHDGRRRAVRHAVHASGTSAMMTSALKMTADRMALSGVASCMTLSAFSAG